TEKPVCLAGACSSALSMISVTNCARVVRVIARLNATASHNVSATIGAAAHHDKALRPRAMQLQMPVTLMENLERAFDCFDADKSISPHTGTTRFAAGIACPRPSGSMTHHP